MSIINVNRINSAGSTSIIIGHPIRYSSSTATAIFASALGDSCTASSPSSHAEGRQTTASGFYSHAEGRSTTSSGGASHAEGFNTLSSGNYSHAEGQGTKALGLNSHAEGTSTTASSWSSHAEGISTTAIGLYSHAEGFFTIAGGDYSSSKGDNSIASGTSTHAEGIRTTALGAGSHSEGYETIASGGYSHAEGQRTTANGLFSRTSGDGTVAYESFQSVLGKYNNTINANQLFIIGKGVSDVSRSNAFRVDSIGSVYGAGPVYNTGADYAEYFESLNGESIPLGSVVELDGDKIKICQNPNNAIGVISSTPTMVGNNESGTADEWVDKYEKDVWGRVIMEDYTYEIPNGIDENGGIIYKTVSDKKPKLNPNYDPNVIYVTRAQRPEWNVVGLVGQIKVLKNQEIPDRWIKMKDINDDIALYLIR